MMRRLGIFAVLALLASPALAQVSNQAARRIVKHASDPATCRVGDVYYKTAATIGLYTCTATNTWTLSGGAAPLTLSGATTTLDLLTIKTTDDNTTKRALRVLSSADAEKFAVGPTGRVFASYGTAAAPAYSSVIDAGSGFNISSLNTATINVAGQVHFTVDGGAGFLYVDGYPLRIRSANGAYTEYGTASELLTLSTSGTTTDTTANLLPANSYIDSVTARITTTITTATSWKLGDATIAGRFTAANSTMTANTTDVGLVHLDLTGTSGPRQTAAAKVRVTTVGTPGAGIIRITVHYHTFVPPTS